MMTSRYIAFFGLRGRSRTLSAKSWLGALPTEAAWLRRLEVFDTLASKKFKKPRRNLTWTGTPVDSLRVCKRNIKKPSISTFRYLFDSDLSGSTRFSTIPYAVLIRRKTDENLEGSSCFAVPCKCHVWNQ